MPRLNRDRIRSWLEEHNWSIRRLAKECSALGDDVIPEGTMRNAVNGIDPMRSSRIRLICQATARQGKGIPYGHLVVDNRNDSQDGDIHNCDRDLFARLSKLCERLAEANQLLLTEFERYNNKETNTEALCNLGQELVTLAGEVANLGIDVVRRTNTLSPPADSIE